MNSPLEPTAIVALYSLFLFNLGPKFMKNRDAFSLKKVMMVYNFVQVVLNFVVFLMVSCDCGGSSSLVVFLRWPNSCQILICAAIPSTPPTVLKILRSGGRIIVTLF
jgi:hypothetical protein